MNCQHCNREINNKGSLKAHEMSCKLNPNAIKFPRSPKSGLQKGNVPWNTGKKIGPLSVWEDKYPDEKIFTENVKYNRQSLKRRILTKNLIEYRCACCGIEPVWQGKPMPLILDHINGVNDDNRLENLRFVCSNCDTQLPTYKSKNRKKA